MSSLLAFIWRRRRSHLTEEDRPKVEEDHLYNHHRTFNPRLSPVPPGLLESHSSDATMVMADYKPDEFICIPRRRVVTPDGLKPRRSMVDLRDELLLGDIFELLILAVSSTKNESSTNEEQISKSNSTAIIPVSANAHETALVPVTQIAKPTENASNWKVIPVAKAAQNPSMWKAMPEALSRSQMTWNQQQNRPCVAVLPPLPTRNVAVLPPLPTRSWSTEGAWSSPSPAYSSQNGSWPPSSERNGSWGNTTPSAESPNLVPGRARTAVGNLVALQQDPPGTTPVKETSDDWAYSPQEQSVETMFSPMFSRASSRNNNNASRTYPLPNIAERGVIAGMSQVKSRQAEYHKREEDEEGIESMYSPLHSSKKRGLNADSSASVSTLPTPSPLVRRAGRQPTTTAINNNATGTILPEHHQGTKAVTLHEHVQAGYSWTVTSSSNSSNSNGSKASKRTIKAVTNSVVVLDGNVHVHALDGDMQLAKARSQHHTKEALILAALERLQDDLALVSDVKGLLGGGSFQGMFDWFVPTPLDEEGILTGFSEAKRYSIIEKLDLLLNELISGVNSQEFFLNSSMVDISDFKENAHEELSAALSFCKTLVQMAIPEIEKEESSLQGADELGKWQFLPGLREAIGILPTIAETPPSRGGDSSFFSLPADDDCETPMTSNLSIGASTLTTVFNNGMSPATTPHNGNMARMTLKQQNGLHLRQAIQLISTGLQKLTQACLALSQMDATAATMSYQGLARVVHQIKQTYLQMLAISQRDLKSVVDAFEFEQQEMDDSYECDEDSEDDDDDEEVIRKEEVIMNVSTLYSGKLPNIILDDRGDSSIVTGPLPPLPRKVDLSSTDHCGDGHGCPAPHHRHAEIFECDDDDLRRQMGSTDRDDTPVEEREAAPRDDADEADDCSWRALASPSKTTKKGTPPPFRYSRMEI